MANDERPLSWLERARRVRDGEAELAGKAAEVSYVELQDFVETLLRRAHDAVVLCTRGGMYLEVSDSFCTLTGYRREELLGQTSITLGLVDPNGMRRAVTSDVHSGIEGLYENTIVRKDGARRKVEFSHQFLDGGYTLVIIRDTSRR
ncbi:MAG: PAS domain-containing protein [Nocardiaceae bacterium]|nr:PAS domain-containing protein [Nocardiaceae bacterium]